MTTKNKKGARICAQSGCQLLSSKQSSEASTLVWIVATFIIVAIMAVFFIFMSMIYINNGKSETSVSVTYENSELSATRALIGFLESDAGNGGKIYDLTFNAGIGDGKENERKKIFEDKARAFLQKNYASEDSGLILISGKNQIYSVSNNPISDSSGEAGPTFSGSTKIDFPIPSDRQLKLEVYFG